MVIKVKYDGQWVKIPYLSAGDGSSILEDAPKDDKQYARKNGTWSVINIPDVDFTPVYAALDGKVDKVAGKALSTNDYITADKTKVTNVVEVFESATSSTSATGVKLTLGKRNLVTNTLTDVELTIPVSTSTLAGLMLPADKTKLNGIAAGAEVNVNADWNATSGDAQILNKPDVYTKTEVDSKISSVYRFRGNVASYANLPTSNLVVGDVYNVTDTGANYAVAQVSPSVIWDKLSETVDLTPYATTASMNTALGNKVDKVSGKVLSTNDYTTAEKNKLAGIATSANNYNLPAATTSVLGGVKTSTGITNSSGTISVTYGTAAGTACQGNDSRLSNSRPASDVSAWAKAAAKPTYTASEVGALATSGGTLSGNVTFNTYTNKLTTGETIAMKNSKSQVQDVIRCYDDGDTEANGSELVIQAGGNVYLGSGESASSLRGAFGVTNSETLRLSSDTNIEFYTNCQTIANRVGVVLNTARAFYPQTNNTGTLGTSSNKWNNVYATTLTGALSGNAATASKVNNNFIFKVANGTTEGNNLYTYNGSAAKTINVVAGSNITLTPAANQLTIAAKDTTYAVVGANGSTGLVKNGSTVTSASGYTACPIVSGVPYYKDTNTTYGVATAATDGLMSSLTYNRLSSNFVTGLNFASSASSGSLTYTTKNPINNTTSSSSVTISPASVSYSGLMSAQDKSKLTDCPTASGIFKIVVMTQSGYDYLSNKENTTLYIIVA